MKQKFTVFRTCLGFLIIIVIFSTVFYYNVQTRAISKVMVQSSRFFQTFMLNDNALDTLNQNATKSRSSRVHENVYTNKDSKLNLKQHFQSLDYFGRNYLDNKIDSLSHTNKSDLEKFYDSVKSNKTEALQRIVNPHPFSYITNCPDICKKGTEEEDVFLIVMVPSAVQNHAHREIIRKSWGRNSAYGVIVRVIFLLGKPQQDNDAFIQNAVFQEQAMNKDIVQEDFIDTYNNLTYKTISGLKWITNYCRQTKYTLKIDDHLFVNMINLLNRLMELPYSSSYFIGSVRFNDGVGRSGKWGIEEKVWSPSFYPVFCAGPAYLISTDLVEQLYFASYYVPFFRLEDVYTGFLSLLVDPFPTFLQWGHHYVHSHNVFVNFFTGSNRHKYIFAHIDMKDTYVSVWERILRSDASDHFTRASTYIAANTS